MMIELIQLQLLVIVCLASFVATLPGVFLVLRGNSLMSDAISHAVLLGIALMFLVVQRLDSWWLFAGAVGAGLMTVLCSEYLLSLRYIKKDTAVALIFPLFFSLGVIIVNFYARDVHLDTDIILLGELVFVPFNRLIIAGCNAGPVALWQLLAVGLLNSIFVVRWYRELVYSSFDLTGARMHGMSVSSIHYGLMIITSVTAVALFDIAGSIMTVALIICPAVIGYVLARSVWQMMFFSWVTACVAAWGGYAMAHVGNLAIAGCITIWLGFIFMAAVLFSPVRGIVRTWLIRRRTKTQYEQKLIAEVIQDIKIIQDQDLAYLIDWPLPKLQKYLEYMADHLQVDYQKEAGIVRAIVKGRVL